MGGLRLGVLALLLAVLLPQLKLYFERQGWPDVVILIDDSQSMSADDRYSDEAVQKAAEKLGQAGNFTKLERLRLAKTLLSRPDADWLMRLVSERKVRL